MKRLVLLILIIGLLLPAFQPLLRLQANTDSIWVNDKSLEIVQDSSQESIENYAYLVYPNCSYTTLKTQNYLWVTNKWIKAKDKTIYGCAMQTPLGIVLRASIGVYVQFAGTEHAQLLINTSNRRLSVTPVPGQRTLIVGGDINWVTNMPYKTYFFYNIVGAGESVIHGNERKFQVRSYPKEFLDESGNTLPISEITTSRNGEWMTAVVKNVIMRIHIPSKSMQTFAKANMGSGSGYDMAISNDGRYVAARNIQNLQGGSSYVYDMIACRPNQSYILTVNTAPGCEERDLTPLLRSSIIGFNFISSLRFSFDNQELTAIARHQKTTAPNSTSGQKYIAIHNSGYQRPSLEYMALGDSFSSGEGDTQGNAWYEPGTDTDNNKCHISRRSYPYLLAEQIGLHLGPNRTPLLNDKFHSLACSGAIIEDMTQTNNDYSGQVRDEIRKRDRDTEDILVNFKPGYLAQLEFVQRYQPSVITLSVVGNDIGFKDKLMRCFEPDTCYSTYEDRVEVAKEIENKFDDLNLMYQKIKNASPLTKLYVIGYPQIISTTGSCGFNVRLNEKERVFARELVTYLNAVVKAAAEYSGASYVDVEGSFSGSELCSGAEDKSLAVNGITAGNDIFGVIGNESYHPNPLGHSLLAAKVRVRTSGLTQAMPLPNTNTTAPTYTAQRFAKLLDAPKSNRSINQLNYDDDSGNNVLYRQRWWQTTISSAKNALKPRTMYSVWLNSTPVKLGDFQSDDNGDLFINALIPQDAESGFHSLHIYGKNAVDANIDIYRTVYVAVSENDLDGDGVINEQDSCDAFENSGIDTDQDGVDDACDSFMGEPPVLDGDSENPKPPENNPETEAGDHQAPTTAATQPAPITTHQDLANIALGAPHPAYSTGSTTNITQPRVAAATASTNKPARPDTRNNATATGKYIIPIVATTVLLLLFPRLARHKTHKSQ